MMMDKLMIELLILLVEINLEDYITLNKEDEHTKKEYEERVLKIKKRIQDNNNNGDLLDEMSIFNNPKGVWKWNNNNDKIMNIKTGQYYLLRNSGGVEALVGVLNDFQERLDEVQYSLDCEKRVREILESIILQWNNDEWGVGGRRLK